MRILPSCSTSWRKPLLGAVCWLATVLHPAPAASQHLRPQQPASPPVPSSLAPSQALPGAARPLPPLHLRAGRPAPQGTAPVRHRSNPAQGAGQRPAGAGDQYWSTKFSPKGLPGDVYALAVLANGDLIVGGDFVNAGGNANADYIARWDGSAWQSLGTGANAPVRALVVTNTGNVIAGGDFLNAGGVAAADYIGRWNGTTWQGLGPGSGVGVGGPVKALALAPNGNIVASDGNDVVRWNGTSWSGLYGTDFFSFSGGVRTVAVTSTGQVIAGGEFFDPDFGVGKRNHVVRWDGTDWVAMGLGQDGVVNTLLAGPSGSVVAGGEFTAGGNSVGDYIVQWNGSSWNPMSSAFTSPVVSLTRNAAGEVVAAASGSSSSFSGDYVQRWTGTTWVPVGSAQLAFSPVTISVIAGSPTGGIALGQPSNFFNDNLGYLSDDAYQPIGAGLVQPAGWDPYMGDIVATSAGDFIAGGNFVDAGGNANADYIARWNGTAWQSLGTTPLNDFVGALAVASNGDIIAGGGFLNAGGNAAADYIARWNGTAWQSLGTAPLSYYVGALAIASNGDIIAGGEFLDAGGNFDADYVARWNGTVWQSLGTEPLNGFVGALAIASNGDVFAGGGFSEASGNVNANYVARWNGTAWQSLGTVPLNDFVAALTVAANGDLIVGGYFYDDGFNRPPFINRVARWNGAWQPLGTGTGAPVTAVTTTAAGAIAVGGMFYSNDDGSVDMRGFGIYSAPTNLPSIISFNPASGSIGTSVAITGTNFTGTTAVRFNGTLAPGFSVSGGGTTITVNVPVGATDGPISVTTPVATATSSQIFTVPNQAPTLVGSYSGAPIEVDCFTSGYVPNGTFTFTITDPDDVAGSHTVSVIYTIGVFGTSPNPQPVSFQRTGNQITVTVAAMRSVGFFGSAAPGELTVLVEDAAGNAANYTSPLLGIGLNLSPDAGQDQFLSVAPGDPVFIEGFEPLAVEYLWSSSGSGTFQNESQGATEYYPSLSDIISGSVTLNLQAIPDYSDESHFYCSGQDELTLFFDNSAYQATIDSFSPASGPVGTNVTLNGTNFGGATQVLFNTTNAPGFTVNGAGTIITVNMPAGATDGPISVTTSAGTASSFTSFDVTGANQAPTALALTSATVAENAASGTAVGTFSSTDPNAGNTFTYTLVSGTGSTHNAAFSIVGNQLRTAASFDFETQPTRAIRVRTTDQGNLFFERTFTITVNNVNEAPAISAQTRSIAENSANGTNVGAVIAATDPDAGTTLSYSILGGNAGGAFSFTGNQLKVANVAALDFETTPTFALTVRVSDGTLTAQNTVTVNLTNVVEGPSAPTISGFMPASGPVGTSVTVNGTNFTGATAVRFNGTLAPGFSVAGGGTSLTVNVPAGASDGPVSVATPGGLATSAASFDVTTPAPTGLTFTPAAGSPGSVVRVTGTGFTTASIARFNGAAATGTRYVSATELIATVPFGATTGALTATTGATTLTGSTFTVSGAAAPRITHFSPLRAPVGTTLTLSGANFSGVTGVRFGNVAAPGFVVANSTRLTVPVPAGAASGVRLYVLAAGGMAQSARTFTLISPPTLTTFAPSYGAPGAVVILTGTNLTNATTVTFGGAVEATTFTVESATRLVATIPAGAVTGAISVSTVAGTATTPLPFTVVAGPAPAISSFTPASGPIGTGVAVSGTGLNGATSVTFNGTAATIGSNSASQLTTTVPTGASTGKIGVLTPRGLVLTATPFKVIPTANPAAAPTIASFAPSYGSPGALVMLTGTGFTGATQVRFGGNVNATQFTVNSATLLTATVPAGAVSGPLRVTTPAGTALSAASFAVSGVPAPTVLTFSPASGAPGTLVQVAGSGFTGVTEVKVNGTTALFSVSNASTLSFTVPAGATTGKIDVLASGGLQRSAASFTVVPAPTVRSFSPESGAPGAQVVVTGTNLLGTSSVRFGGISATTYVVNSASQLTAVVPVGAATGVIGVTTPGGSAASTGLFTVTAAPVPTVSGFTPTSGIVGTQVLVTGTNFLNVTQVAVNGKPAESFLVTSATTLLVSVPDGATTGPVSVRTSGGQALSATPFTVLVAPDIDTFAPIRGPVGTVVTVTGTAFTGATAVTVGGVNTPVYTVNSATRLTLTVPAGATTGQLSITTPAATSFSAQVFTLTGSRPGPLAPADSAASPAFVSVYPNPAPAAGFVTVEVREWPLGQPLPLAELFDAVGRRVRTALVGPDGTVRLALGGLPASVYTVRCGGVSQRLLVTR